MLLYLTVLCTQFILVSCWAKASVSLVNSNYNINRCSMVSTDESYAIPTNDIKTNYIKVLGICGGIGSGKSSACEMLVSELNCLAHIDSDTVAHSVYEFNSPALHDVVNGFGSDILISFSGEIDRKKLGSIVFADNDAMKRLERIVWPHVKTKIMHQIEIIKSDQTNEKSNKIPIIVVEAAVLLDAEWTDFLDGIWVVTSSQQVALQRLQNTRGLSTDDATKRIHAQMSRRGIGNLQHEVDAGTVSAVIQNDGTMEDLKVFLSEKIHDPNAWYQHRQ
jgi:dephospho-CoA kinase